VHLVFTIYDFGCFHLRDRDYISDATGNGPVNNPTADIYPYITWSSCSERSWTGSVWAYPISIF